jgi:hypothetical protein
MVESRPRARAVLIWILVGLAVIALYFVLIASGEADNNASGSGGLQATGALGDASQTPAATAVLAATVTP